MFPFPLIQLLSLLQMHSLVCHAGRRLSERGASLSARAQRRWAGQLSHRLDKFELLLLLDLLDFEDVLQRGVVEELPLLIDLCVGLRMSKHGGEDKVGTGVNPAQKSRGVKVGGLRVNAHTSAWQPTANRDMQTTASYFKCAAVLLETNKKKNTGGSEIFLLFYLLQIRLLLLGRQAEMPLQRGVVLLRLLVELLLALLQGEETVRCCTLRNCEM